MRLLIEFRAVMLCLAIVLSTAVCRAQISGTTSNPGQYLAIKKGEDNILSKITAQTNYRKKEARTKNPAKMYSGLICSSFLA